MALSDKVSKLRSDRSKGGGAVTPDAYQGVTKSKIREVLGRLDLANNVDLIDAVFALLDDQSESWFSTAPKGARFSDGASTAHVGAHVGMLQRGGAGKLDREGRDYWIKPLRDLGAIEAVTLYDGKYLAGHVIPKSSNSSYRLAEDFKAILREPAGSWEPRLAAWSAASAIRQRHEFQAHAAQASRKLVGSGHSDLIAATIETYAPKFLPGFSVIYVDDGDGDRITDEDRARMTAAGVELKLGDAMPDVLLWNRETDQLWVIEAVTSDGEVDQHKVNQIASMAKRAGKAGVGFTTAYRTWKDAAARQSAHQNLAVDSFVWIEADPAKHLHVESFP